MSRFFLFHFLNLTQNLGILSSPLKKQGIVSVWHVMYCQFHVILEYVMNRLLRTSGYRIQPYHMNGLNWRIVPETSETGNIVVVTGFMPAWWEAEYNITFGTDFHTNFRVHQKTLVKMESLLKERFGDLPNFFCGDDYANSYACERRYGDGLVPALFGGKVEFEDESGHPFAVSMDLTDEEAENLTIPDLQHHPVIETILDPEKGGFESVSGELGFEGVLNIAFKLRGQEIFVDMIQKRQLFQHMCSVVNETIDKLVHMVREWQDPGHTRPTFFVTCNCLMNMISNTMYEDQLFSFDTSFSNSFEMFGMHTCNWIVDPYLDAIAKISDTIDYLDMGCYSDLDRVHKLFPGLRPAVFIHPEIIRQSELSEIGEKVSELCKKLISGSILLSDLEAGTDDSAIRKVYEVAAKF